MQWKAGLAALGGATVGGLAGWAITHYAMRGRGGQKQEGTGTLIGAAVGMIVGASIPTSTTTTTAITKS